MPSKYISLAVSHLNASAQDVAYLYAAYAKDKATSLTDATNFEDALRQHRLIYLYQTYATSKSFY